MWPFGKSTEKRLKEAIQDQKHLADLGLDVNIKKKTAIISGTVPSDNYKGLIQAVAEGINGVKEVDLSGIKVEAATPQADTASAQEAQPQHQPTQTTGRISSSMPVFTPQTDPSAKAKAALAKIKGEASLANNPLDVLQSGDTIILRGAVDSTEEHAKAKSLAASVEGVANVNTSGLQVIQNASQLNETDDDGDIVYTVQSGDTLSHIALHYYGDAGRKWYMKNS